MKQMTPRTLVVVLVAVIVLSLLLSNNNSHSIDVDLSKVVYHAYDPELSERIFAQGRLYIDEIPSCDVQATLVQETGDAYYIKTRKSLAEYNGKEVKLLGEMLNCGDFATIGVPIGWIFIQEDGS